MPYLTFPPPASLADIVRYFWVFEGEASEAQPYIHCTFANVCPELLFHYRGEFRECMDETSTTSSFLTGIHCQTRQYRKFIVRQSFGIFGVYFYPHGLATLFGVPAIELTDQLPELDAVIKLRDKAITDSMLSASDTQERITLITRFLETRRKELRRPEIGHAIHSIIRAKGQTPISSLASQSYLSVRQFERVFKEHAGFSPKTFARIARFYAVVEETLAPKRSLQQIAFDYGYYDQSHFISDFKEFSGLNPGTWFNSRPADLCID
jgi:AraC-like DNA-binding protein